MRFITPPEFFSISSAFPWKTEMFQLNRKNKPEGFVFWTHIFQAISVFSSHQNQLRQLILNASG